MFDIGEQIQQAFAPNRIGIEEFAESTDFCAKTLYPRQKLLLKLMFLEELSGREWDIVRKWERDGQIDISPHLEYRIDYLRSEGFRHFREVVMVGGRRCSKGFITGIALAKLMYDTLQLQDPGLHYGVDREKQIYFTCVAASLDQARKYQYADFSTTVGGCKAFDPYLTKLYEREFSVATQRDLQQMQAHKRKSHKIGRDISKLRGVALAANASTIRGSATMAVVFDEMAHMETGEETEASSDRVYDAAIPSLAQFREDAMIFCCSSPYTKLGRFFERYQAGMTEENGKPLSPFTVAFRFPSWALFDGWWEEPTYLGKKHCVTQSPDWDPERTRPDGSYFYTREDRQGILLARDEERQNPETYKVERRGQFAEVVDAYLDPSAVDRMFRGRPAPGGQGHIPYRANFTDAEPFLFRYVAHLDPSSTTAGFGFALGHNETYADREGNAIEHVVFDIIKRWDPKTFDDGVIDWRVVLDEVFRYVQLFRPVEVTMDQFNSDAPIQWLNEQIRVAGIPGTRVYKKTATAETNWNRAEVFRTALYMDLVHAPGGTEDIAWAAKELKFLQQRNTSGRFPRVDKPDIGPVQTKDEADAIMTVTETLIGNTIARRMMDGLSAGLSYGAEGGYRMGGDHPQGSTAAALSDFYNGRAGRKGEQSAPRRQERDFNSYQNVARRGTWSRGPRRGR